MKIHRAGARIISLILLVWLFLALTILYFTSDSFYFWSVAGTGFLVLLFVLRFFRVPARIPGDDMECLYSPADGKVVALEQAFEEEYLKRECIQVSVFMSVWNVHVNWFPSNGILKKFIYHPGKFLMAKLPKSSELNERTTVVVETHSGTEIVVRQIAGIVARRIESYVPKQGGEVKQGQELGFIKFGSRVDLFIPVDSEILVKLGQKVRGQVTPVARVTGNKH